ncbi:hypothetical protein FOZ60_013845 [Perkinsus olseni]|uniref:Uncharacterized protein n=1 Tax=Perkinsus olseni TaxID=32597 RepID=A0A7J6N8N4_PEROL|nr:hypothetical protein FOZ60_013845 [Perkinsus olseni]
MSNSGDNPIIGDDGENAIFNAGVQTTPPREEDGRGIPPPVMVNQPPPVQPGASSGGISKASPLVTLMALYSHVIVENVCDVNGPHGTIWKALTYDEDVLAEIVLEGLDAQGLRRVYPQHCRVAEVVHHVITATRGHMTSNWCYGCKRRHCENPISVKDFDTMQNVIRTLRPDTTFEGAKDSRSGTTWISVMYHETEGHPDVSPSRPGGEVIESLSVRHYHQEPLYALLGVSKADMYPTGVTPPPGSKVNKQPRSGNASAMPFGTSVSLQI